MGMPTSQKHRTGRAGRFRTCCGAGHRLRPNMCRDTKLKPRRSMWNLDVFCANARHAFRVPSITFTGAIIVFPESPIVRVASA